MLRWVMSPGLGVVGIYDTPFPPGLAPWLPWFHVTEVQLLKRSPVVDWQAVADVKAVFPGAYVVQVRDLVAEKKRWERRMQRVRRFGSGRPEPVEREDEEPRGD